MTKREELLALAERMDRQINEWLDDEPQEDWWQYQRDFLAAYQIVNARAQQPADQEVGR